MMMMRMMETMAISLIPDCIRRNADTWSSDQVYSMRTLRAALYRVKNTWQYSAHTKKHIAYLDLPVSFDIKTSSFLHHDAQCASMYVWIVCIGGVLIYGRTWAQFVLLLKILKRFFDLGPSRKLVIYTHMLPYKYQFFRLWVKWSDVFAMGPAAPAYAEAAALGIVFRDSYILTRCRVEELITKVHIRLGRPYQLDRETIRTPDTRLTASAVSSVVSDALIICVYIAEQIKKEGSVKDIPMTKTGYIRRDCRDYCYYCVHIEDETQRRKSMFAYRKVMQELTLTPDEFLFLQTAFSGGFAHQSNIYGGELVHDCISYDQSSAYIAAIVLDYYPMSKGICEDSLTVEQYLQLCKKYCVVATVTLHNVRPRIDYECYIQQSKCQELEDASVSAGRVRYCRRCTLTITEIDLNIINQVYDFDLVKVHMAYRYKRGRLPRRLVEYCAKMYARKTWLKGDEERQREYNAIKEDLLSIYGMFVTSPVREQFTYDCDVDKWNEPSVPDLDDAIEQYNKKFTRFTSYAWGPYVTAHCRRRTWNAILNIGRDYVYSDTDCVKFLRPDKHKAYIDEYNKLIEQQIDDAARALYIDADLLRPKDSHGHVHPLGAWELDAVYSDFKSLGAKRYLTRDKFRSDKLKATMSGVNPLLAARYLSMQYPGREFKKFDIGLEIPASNSGRLQHWYHDARCSGYINDYTGRPCRFLERSYIYTERSSFKLCRSAEFEAYIASLGDVEFV